MRIGAAGVGRGLTLALLAGASLAACDEQGGAEEPAEAMEAVPADRPLLDPGVVSAEEVFRLGPSLQQLERPGDVAADERGFVYVLDLSRPTQILKYDSSGQFVLRFGAQDAEQRLVAAAEFALAPWNTILLVDVGRDALTSYLTIGTYASSVSIEPGLGLGVLTLPQFSEFYLHSWNPETRSSIVHHVRAPFEILHTTYEIVLPPGLTVREEARGVHFHTAVGPRGNLFVGFWDDYPVRVLTPAGETVRVIELDRAPLPKSRATMERERQSNLAVLSEQMPAMDERLLEEAARPDSLHPLVEELAVDPLGRLWVRTNRPDTIGRPVTPYDVFDEAGQYLMRIDLSVDVVRTSFAPDGTLYVAAIVDDSGRHEIRGYEIVTR